MTSEQLREAGFFAVNETSIKEWHTIESNEPEHTAPTEEIIETLIRLEHEDNEDNNEDITDEPTMPSQSQAFTSLSISLWWLEAQPDCDPIALQILY